MSWKIKGGTGNLLISLKASLRTELWKLLKTSEESDLPLWKYFLKLSDMKQVFEFWCSSATKELYDKKQKQKPNQPTKKEQKCPRIWPGGSYTLKTRFPADFFYNYLNFCLFLFPFLGSTASLSSGPTNPPNIKELEQDRAVLQQGHVLRGLHMGQSRALCVPCCSHSSSNTKPARAAHWRLCRGIVLS